MWPRTWPGLPDDGRLTRLETCNTDVDNVKSLIVLAVQWVRGATDLLNFTDEVDWNWPLFPTRPGQECPSSCYRRDRWGGEARNSSEPATCQTVHQYGFSRLLWLIERSWCRARWAGCHEKSLRPASVVLRLMLVGHTQTPNTGLQHPSFNHCCI